MFLTLTWKRDLRTEMLEDPHFCYKINKPNENICALMFEKLGGEVEQAKIILREMSAAWSLFSLQFIFSS
jgi:hypothetical protein